MAVQVFRLTVVYKQATLIKNIALVMISLFSRTGLILLPTALHVALLGRSLVTPVTHKVHPLALQNIWTPIQIFYSILLKFLDSWNRLNLDCLKMF